MTFYYFYNNFDIPIYNFTDLCCRLISFSLLFFRYLACREASAFHFSVMNQFSSEKAKVKNSDQIPKQ